ncbi:MAG: hypothetical protein A3D16_06150 [Rhodobacterales bacterium RIFCSPHIGHO2_02_FULL_62_130]|nr:MAG: hypothetical protein A3D16_06150 [Rhodobacterales bacterium RIFCSPHIGHO2_02_FULL_62_130]OHC56830.1 MAG: hypothetical protein A3E48_07860 [Rhodobacterales bacterium RIFCSPHIGHO2_12_FULL_62_75]HCZ00356.1 hypothetical protein [Rhodobacter sp.]
MIPQFQTLRPLSQTEAAPQIGQGVADVEFADIFTMEDEAQTKAEPAIDTIMPNLLQVMILAMPPANRPTADQHAFVTESSADLLPPVSTDQTQSAALSPITTSAIDTSAPDVPELDVREIGATPSLPNLPMQPTADTAVPAIDQNLSSAAPRADVLTDMLQLLPEQKEPSAVASAVAVTDAKITSQAVPSLQQLATLARAITEQETVATIKAAEEQASQIAHDLSVQKDDTTGSADSNLPEPFDADFLISETVRPEANQTKITLIPPSTANLAQVAPPTTPPLLHASPEAVASMIIAHTTRPESGPVEVILNPQELGHLRFMIRHDGDQVKVILTVERPDTLDLIRRHVEQLLADLRQAGFADATLSFGQWQQSGGGENRQTPLLLDEQTPPSLPDSVFSPTQPWPSRSDLGGHGLNLRL